MEEGVSFLSQRIPLQALRNLPEKFVFYKPVTPSFPTFKKKKTKLPLESLRYLSFCSSSKLITRTCKWDSFYNVSYLWLLIYKKGSQKWKQFLPFSFFFKLKHEDHICSSNHSAEFQYSTTSNSRWFIFKIRLDLASQPLLMCIPSIPALSFYLLLWHLYCTSCKLLYFFMQNAFYQYDGFYSGASLICFAGVRNSECKNQHVSSKRCVWYAFKIKITLSLFSTWKIADLHVCHISVNVWAVRFFSHLEWQ